MPEIYGWQVVRYLQQLEEQRPRRWWQDVDWRTFEVVCWLLGSISVLWWIILGR